MTDRLGFNGIRIDVNQDPEAIARGTFSRGSGTGSPTGGIAVTVAVGR